MNKFEWYCKYGLDREMKNFSPKLHKETSCNQFELKTLDWLEDIFISFTPYSESSGRVDQQVQVLEKITVRLN